MSINDKKIAKLLEKSALLEKRIQTATEELKKTQSEIKILTFDNLEIDLSRNDLSTEDYAFMAKIKKKMSGNNISFSDVEKMLDDAEEKNEEKIF
ncbi:MAG: hypothetical protein K2K02_08230 [Ruminococcus sp.]|nr:hypothetical protein [Ruminococcus sp.]